MEKHQVSGLNLAAEGVVTGQRASVPYALPGDTVVLETGAIEPSSPHRAQPTCPHFGQCGGCALQHASDAFVANWKLDVTKRALLAHGLSAPFRPIQTSAPESRRRAVFAARRTKKTTQVGFHGRKSDAVVPISQCDVLSPEIVAALPLLQSLTRLGASRSGTIRIHVTTSLNGLDIDLIGAKPLDMAQMGALTDMLQSAAVARLSWNGEPQLRFAPAHQSFGAALVEPPPGAFLQATREGEAALLAGVREAVGDVARVLDLFAGCGTFSLPLAAQAEVLAVEAASDMLQALEAGWRHASGLKAVETQVRDLFRRPMLAAEFKGYEAAVIDPPRAGAEAQVAEIAASDLARVAAVSCNPVTFARDARSLTQAGFSLDWVQVVDQFRWSPHVELVAQFSR